MPLVDPLLLTTVRLTTFSQGALLTNATAFFFTRHERLFLVTGRHVMHDELNNHVPDSINIDIHTNPDNLAEAVDYTIPLYRDEQRLWRQGMDVSGEIDVAVIEIDKDLFPASAAFQAFTTDHLLAADEHVDVGCSLLIVGYPLGFYDNLHHMPIVRHAVLASSFGLRFQGQGFFLTDARTHRGISGAPVVMATQEVDQTGKGLSWKLLGIHSARLDIGTRDLKLDEVLGLNCSWYSDILLTLTED